MKFNIFAAILLVLELNTNIIATGGVGNGSLENGTTNNCHGDCTSSEFSKN